MLRRSNPWPAIVDLFAALMLLAFGGMMVLSIGRDGPTELDRKANEMMRTAQQQLEKAHVPAKLRPCGRDRCIDVSVQFETDRDVIYKKEQLKALEQVCQALKTALDELKSEQRMAVQLLVEGHTDSRPPKVKISEKDYFLYNWGLSARRAGAVLYEFKAGGLVPPRYNITAVGKADTDNLCAESTEECWARNRRITLRLQIDTLKFDGKN
jgi:flagellar motor protein MotB